jgi:cobyrinic acid a,c-diamide synthase
MDLNQPDAITSTPKCKKCSILVISGTNSGVGKTTVTVGLMTAFAQRGYIVQPFKTGPDFLDGMHHEAGIRAGEKESEFRNYVEDDVDYSTNNNGHRHRHRHRNHRRCINLDGWMMRSPEIVLASFHYHCQGADICIIEGAMGLHDSKDGISDDGSAAQIAKWLNAPVVLVVDGSKCARSVAAMALGYTILDKDMRMGAVVVNRVGGKNHINWIRDAVEHEGTKKDGLLKDVYTGEAVLFAGALPKDGSVAVPERHLGLTMPNEQQQEHEQEQDGNKMRYLRLAALVEENLELEKIFKLGQTSCQVSSFLSNSIIPALPILQPQPTTTCCRIGIAQDEAFCFYYRDNLHLLRLAGAELVSFSPLTSSHLPPALDALYIGGGYPELHAQKLQENETLRNDIRSFSQAGGAIFAECGGLMYLSNKLLLSKTETYNMCGVLPISTRMTSHCKMYYASIEFSSHNPLFPNGAHCRGQLFHFSEIIEEGAENETSSPFMVTPQLPGADPEPAGIIVNNTFASYLHLHFASFVDDGKKIASENNAGSVKTKTLADHFVEKAIATSPHRKSYAVSFVSAATEIVFALRQESALAGVTSICDYPTRARCAPRRIVCRPSIDAASMTSEEVEHAMEEIRKQKSEHGKEGPPRHWFVDGKALQEMNPRVVFVQNTCDICDASSDDVLYALKEHGLSETTSVVRVAPTTLHGLFDSIRDIATALDCHDRGKDLIQSLQERIGRVKHEIAQLDTPIPRILSLEGLAPLCTGGHWLPDLKYESGCIDALGDIGGCPAKILTWDEIVDADPDILVISPCSATPTRTLNELHLLASNPAFWKLRCVQKGNVYIIDHSLFSRPGPRLVEGIEMMATLFRRITPPSPSILKKWDKEILKYDCSTKDECSSIFHCTTELAARFSPCLIRQKNDDECSTAEKSSQIVRKNGLRSCNVTRCTIPNFQLPDNRSAHCLIPIRRKMQNNVSLLLIGGENSQAQRLNDTWELHPPSKGWNSTSECNDKDLSPPTIGTTSTWEYLRCGKIAGEDVPTRRSNHAAAACGDHVLIFGGWGVDNVTPLTHCELLHIESLCWTHCSTRGPFEPSPRGNPTLVYSDEKNCAFLFGGWNGKHALNDLWCLDMNQWQWQELVQTSSIIDDKSAERSWPTPRTDHTSVLWKRDEKHDSMLVFGGNIEGHGPCSELWELVFSTTAWNDTRLNGENNKSYHWDTIEVSGPKPSARTSHTAAIVGRRNHARMVIVGGTSSALGAGHGSVLCDAWILDLDRGQKDGTPAWLQLDWSGNGVDRCRHSMAFVDAETIVMYGGYDGEVTVDERIGVWQGHVPLVGDKEGSVLAAEFTKSKKHEKAQDRWTAEIPVRVEDLPPATLAKAKRSRLPGAIYKTLHRHAVSHNRDTYIDPDSGYSVLSEVYLKRKPCCGNGCRHCPHGHVNVPGNKKKYDNTDSELDW